MDQSEGMADLVDHFLSEPLQEQGFIGRHAIKLIIQAVKRCDAGSPAKRGLSENESKDGDEQVNTE